MPPELNIAQFIAQHQLPEHYNNTVTHWFAPVVARIAAHINNTRTWILGINGAQGSGKSTLADLIVFLMHTQHQIRSVALSIDDFYFTRQERMTLARTIHPLFATRGAPGTHDIPFALQTLDALCATQGRITIPRFNKAMDDRYPQSEWETVQAPIQVIILEGWCLGAEPVPQAALQTPINALEREQDQHAIWRTVANNTLQTDYPALFNRVDCWLMLQAPSFACVHQWRQEQEDKLRQAVQRDTTATPVTNLMDAQTLARFIQYFQRITEQVLITLPTKAHFVFELDPSRTINRLRCPVTLDKGSV